MSNDGNENGSSSGSPHELPQVIGKPFIITNSPDLDGYDDESKPALSTYSTDDDSHASVHLDVHDNNTGIFQSATRKPPQSIQRRLMSKPRQRRSRSPKTPKPHPKPSELFDKFQKKRARAREMYREALNNTNNTITLVAVLIATFTYSAGFNPPGGLHQDGPLIGTSVAAKKTAFRVFLVCNNLALFISLSVVLVFVSIIPFKKKALKRMLAVAHKVVWVAVSFMATAYVAGAMVIMEQAPRPTRGVEWTTVFLLCVCVGSLGSAVIGLGIMLVKHRLRKREWKKDRARKRLRQIKLRKDEYDVTSSSSDSDIYDSAKNRGYHSF